MAAVEAARLISFNFLGASDVDAAVVGLGGVVVVGNVISTLVGGAVIGTRLKGFLR